jgi:hypothetical protein
METVGRGDDSGFTSMFPFRVKTLTISMAGWFPFRVKTLTISMAG